MTSPESGQTESRQPHPIVADVASWVIDLTDIGSIPRKQFLRDAIVPGKAWIDAEGQLQVPVGVFKKNLDGSLEVITAQSSPDGGEATLNHIPVEDTHL